VQDSRFGLEETRAIGGERPTSGKQTGRESFGGMQGARGWPTQPAGLRSRQAIQHASADRGAVAFGRNVCELASEETENGRKIAIGEFFFAA
jgi:hypothetical protein